MGEIMKKIKVSDADYEVLMSLSKELQLQPNHHQAFPYYWEPQSDRREYNLNGEGKFKIVVLDEEWDPVELAEEDDKLFGEFLADEDIVDKYQEWDGDLEGFLAKCGDYWVEWLKYEKGYTIYTYNLEPKTEHNPSLFLDDVKGYIEHNQHHLGANAHTYANTIQRMPRMEKLVEALYRLNPQAQEDICSEAWGRAVGKGEKKVTWLVEWWRSVKNKSKNPTVPDVMEYFALGYGSGQAVTFFVLWCLL